MSKSAEAFRTISEVAAELGVPKHVLRFWEAKFAHVRPMKRGGGRRFYRPEDMELLYGIRHLLHREGYTIRGVQKILREQGVDAVKHRGRSRPPDGAAGKAAPRRKKAAASRPRARRPAVADQRSSGSARAGEGWRKHVLRAIAELESCRKMLVGEARRGGRSRGEAA